jgi:signal peptidase I
MNSTDSTDSTDSPGRTVSSVATRWLINVVALAVLLLAAPMVVADVLGYERYVITGGSMSGTIERGSLVFERPVPIDRLRVGDVITYQPPAESGLTNLVTHRIHSIEHTETGAVLRTKGDANADPDQWRFQLDGPSQPRVEVAVPHAGYVFVFLGDRSNRLLVIGLPAVAIALLSLRELIRALRRPREPRRPEDQPRRPGPMPAGA